MKRVSEQRVFSITSNLNLNEFSTLERLVPKVFIKLPALPDDTLEEYMIWDVDESNDYDYNARKKDPDEMFAPSGILNQTESESENPFPTNSLFITTSFEDSQHCGGSHLIKTEQFFVKFGHHLTCLVLSNYALSPLQFTSLLSQVPHLKSLTLGGTHFISHGEHRHNLDRSTCILPPLPRLTHLQLTVINSETEDGMNFHFIPWILERYSQQLIQLSAENHKYSNDYVFWGKSVKN